MFKIGALGSYFAGIATVVIALGTGFEIGTQVGNSWGSIERLPVVVTNESRPLLTERREIPLVLTATTEAPDEQAVATQAKADKTAAAARKAAAERRNIARMQRRKSAERTRRIALAAAKMQASGKPAELNAIPGAGSNTEFAPQANSQPFGNYRAPAGQAP